MGRGGSLGYDGGAKVYVGGLRYGATERDVERMFDKYGPVSGKTPPQLLCLIVQHFWPA